MDDEDEVTYTSNTYTNGQNENPSDGEDDDNDEDDEKGVNDVEDDDEDDDDDDDDGNGVQRISKDDYEYGDDDDDGGDGDGDEQRHPKKRKLKNLISSYEFAPRQPPPPSSAPPSLPKPSYGGRNPLTDWTEHETLVLLDAWGDRFLKHGRKSLRSEEWQEVAEKVSEGSKIERTDTQCRNRLDTLKKKYKKEKMKIGGGLSEWVYFKKMDGLLSSQIQQSAGLSCGVDSGEYVFMNPRVYLNRSNGSDEMTDSPGGQTEGEESDGLPPKKAKSVGGGSFKMIADSFRKFSEIYERIESSKRQQMVELEKMRMDLHRDLELQKTEILERARAAIAKIRTGEDEDNGGSGENASG